MATCGIIVTQRCTVDERISTIFASSNDMLGTKLEVEGAVVNPNKSAAEYDGSRLASRAEIN